MPDTYQAYVAKCNAEKTKPLAEKEWKKKNTLSIRSAVGAIKTRQQQMKEVMGGN